MKQKYRRTAATWIAQQQGDLAPMHLTIPELAELAESIAPRLPHGGGSGSGRRLPKPSKVHGKGLEPLCLAAAEPKSAASASFATRAVNPWGIRGAIVTGGSVAASSGIAASGSQDVRSTPVSRCGLQCSDNRGRDPPRRTRFRPRRRLHRATRRARCSARRRAPPRANTAGGSDARRDRGPIPTP
jgi:hypothetical protein